MRKSHLRKKTVGENEQQVLGVRDLGSLKPCEVPGCYQGVAHIKADCREFLMG